MGLLAVPCHSNWASEDVVALDECGEDLFFGLYSAERSGSAFAWKSGDHKELKTGWRVYIRSRANFIKLNRWSKFEGLVLLIVVTVVN